MITMRFQRIKFMPGPIMGCLLCASRLVAHGSFMGWFGPWGPKPYERAFEEW